MISEKAHELIVELKSVCVGHGCVPTSESQETMSSCTQELEDYIASLESENARLLQARRWILVGERLPEEAGWYLAKVENKTTFTFRSYETVYFANGKFHSNVTNDQMDFMTITHWRILPELQEEVDG